MYIFHLYKYKYGTIIILRLVKNGTQMFVDICGTAHCAMVETAADRAVVERFRDVSGVLRMVK